MIDLLARLLPVAVGGAISPTTTIICILLLSSRRQPFSNAAAFVVGNGLVLTLIGILALSILGGGTGSETGSSTIGHTIDAVLGVVFLVFAFKSYLNLPDPNAPPPKWMSSLDSIVPAKAFVFGTIVMTTNFTTLALFISGLKEIVLAKVGVAGSTIAFVVLILIVLSELLVPIIVYAVAPERVGAILGFVRQWLEKNNRVIMLVFFAVFGALLLVKGLLGLSR